MYTEFDIRMKAYESHNPTSRRLMPGLPTVVRIDGRAFHNVTAKCDRPFDDDIIELFNYITRKLVEQTNARIGYTQSDEISLLFYQSDQKSEMFFGGKLYKLLSVLPSIATYEAMKFISGSESLKKKIGDKPIHFDARIFQLPSLTEAINVFVWREQDAVRNSIYSLARSYFSATDLFGKTCNEMQYMLSQLKGINWNDLPARKKRGNYFKRATVSGTLLEEERETLPEKHHARSDPNFVIQRSYIKCLDIDRLSSLNIEERFELFMG